MAHLDGFISFVGVFNIFLKNELFNISNRLSGVLLSIELLSYRTIVINNFGSFKKIYINIHLLLKDIPWCDAPYNTRC